jgi:hypothetical protein
MSGIKTIPAIAQNATVFVTAIAMHENNRRDKMKIINFTKILKGIKDAEEGAWYDDGIDAINSLDMDTANRIMTFLLTYVMTEVRVGLGLMDTEEDPGELKIYDKIAEIYEEAAEGCYFCSDLVDPNADEYGPDTRVCPMHVLKLANFTQALGINPQEVFKGIAPRRIQKARIKVRHERDTRLITAAPDLLEACKKAISEIRHLENMLGNAEYQDCLVYETISKAISKAEGRE